MLNKKNGVIVATIISVCCFLFAVYISSCTKPGKVYNCDYVVCQNKGFCVMDTVKNSSGVVQNIIPQCVCPTGWEGANCATASVTKFLGTWDVKQTVIGSDSLDIVGTDSLYSVQLQQSATPTTFLIWGLCGDPNYNDVVCTIDSINTNKFVIDTLSAFHMVFDHFKLLQNAQGIIIPGSSITTTLCVKRLNYNINWQHDTLSIVMTPHKN